MPVLVRDESRRRVLRWLVFCLSTLGGWGWMRLGSERRKRSRPRRVPVARPVTDGIFFYEHFILVREGSELRALSSRCTHLGCRIDRALGDTLLCPCHGSSFDARGARLSGPATANLRSLAVEAPTDRDTLVIALADD